MSLTANWIPVPEKKERGFSILRHDTGNVPLVMQTESKNRNSVRM